MQHLITRLYSMLCLLDVLVSGAIYTSECNMTIDGVTTFVGNAANDSGGETQCAPRRIQYGANLPRMVE